MTTFPFRCGASGAMGYWRERDPSGAGCARSARAGPTVGRRPIGPHAQDDREAAGVTCGAAWRHAVLRAVTSRARLASQGRGARPGRSGGVSRLAPRRARAYLCLSIRSSLAPCQARQPGRYTQGACPLGSGDVASRRRGNEVCHARPCTCRHGRSCVLRAAAAAALGVPPVWSRPLLRSHPQEVDHVGGR